MVKELRNQLKSQTLNDVSPSAFKQVGGSVYPDEPSVNDLDAFRQIVDSFVATHLPTLGYPIPQSTDITTSVLSTTETNLLTAGDNEVLEVLSISCPGGTAESMSAGMLQVSDTSGQDVPFAQLPLIDDLTVSFSGLIYGHVVEVVNYKQIMQPVPLFLNGGDSLSIKVKSAPDNPITFTILYRMRMQ